MDQYFIGTVDTVSHNQSLPANKNACVNIELGPNFKQTKFKIDTGSSVNTLPLKCFESLNVSSPLEPPDAKLTSYSGDSIQVHGKVVLNCVHKQTQLNATFYVVNDSAPPLLSLQTSVDLGLIELTYAINQAQYQPMTKSRVMTKYSDLFKVVGTLPGKSKLHLRDDAVPVIAAPRRIPEALKSRLKKELDQMVMDKIITPVTEPTDWVHPIVLIEKK